MNNFIAVTFPDAGLTYEVSLAALSQSVAATMAKTQPMNADTLAKVVSDYFEDSSKVRDLAGKMPWAELRGCSRLIEYSRPHGPGAVESAVWSEGYDEPRRATLPDAAEQGTVPLDLHLSVMWQLGASVSAQVFHDHSTGQPNGAMIFVAGNKEQIDAYLAVCAQLCTQMGTTPATPPPQPTPGGNKRGKKVTNIRRGQTFKH